ncbi:MAG: O-sialoglycoprotein endopeptidase [Patescibacteria group bacterium]
MNVHLGLDTSCYTTSFCAVDEAGSIVFDGRVPLAVAPGLRGLRQSEALFQHLQNLGPLLAGWRNERPRDAVLGVAVSERPRPAEGSYLPVFLAGLAAARALAAGAGVALHAVTHQEGHLRAALHGVADPPPEFLALHLSGGTTEILRARARRAGYSLEPLGGTGDLHAGQFIDRLGVAMGLPFPAGPALEELAQAGREGALRLPVAVDGLRVSFSGPLSAAERALRGGAPHADLAAAALACLARSVRQLLETALDATGLDTAVIGGGVAANRRLRTELAAALPAIRCIFAEPRLAVDNAVGVALLGWDLSAHR